jgi:hypothetical protein
LKDLAGWNVLVICGGIVLNDVGIFYQYTFGEQNGLKHSPANGVRFFERMSNLIRITIN